MKKSTDKPSLSEREAKIAKREESQRGKKIDKDRQHKSSRNGGALKKSLKVTLTGAERFWIRERIEKVTPSSARTEMENRLLKKVK